jgi:hypothetical protein
VAVVFVVVCIGSVAGLYLWYASEDSTTADLLARLPVENSTVLFADIEALRDSGLLELLAGTGVDEEPDYREFVDKTGFDYRSDLDSVLAAFHTSDSYFLARGRFEWRQLNRYVKDQGGFCQNGRCLLHGSVPERRISYVAITYNVMALASSVDAWAVLAMEQRGNEPPRWSIPDEPFWVSIPAASLMAAKWLPVGTQSFARALAEKDRVIFSIGQAETGYEAKVRVECSSARDASGLAAELQRVTDLLRDLIRLENKTPNPNDLSGVLSSGVFEHSGYAVIGRWPVSREFLEAIAAGATGEQQEAAAAEEVSATTP